MHFVTYKGSSDFLKGRLQQNLAYCVAFVGDLTDL